MMARIEIGMSVDGVGDGDGSGVSGGVMLVMVVVVSVDGVGGDDSVGPIRVMVVRMEIVMSIDGVDCGGDEEIQNTVMGIAMVKVF